MKKLYFVRHGESEANAKRLFAGRWDVPLTELGLAQAHHAGRETKSLGIDLIVSSPLKRARQTAETIASEIGYPKDKIVYSDLFKERDYGAMQEKPWDDATGINFDTIPGAEKEAALLERATEGAKFIRNLPEDNILIVGHGTNGRAILRSLTKQEGEVEVSLENEIPNGHPVRWI